MSRGGRGGAGAGRGGRELKGIAWVPDPQFEGNYQPTKTFPQYAVPISAPITENEKRQIRNYKGLREQIHQGPLFTQPSKRDPNAPAKTYSEDQFNERYGVKTKSDIDPFTGVPTYSMKYEQKKRVIPQLSGRPFNKELFPKELWSTLDGEDGQKVRNHINRAVEKRLILAETGQLDPEERKKALEAKIKEATKGIDEDENLEGEEEFVEEDYDYEDDELEMGGDYDGEQYFDGGEDDIDDGGEGGGGEDDY